MEKEETDTQSNSNGINNSHPSNNAKKHRIEDSYTSPTMVLNIALLAILFISQDPSMLKSVLGAKRVVYQTFFDNLHASCYGTCTQGDQGSAGATSNVRCQGNKVRLECERNHVIKTSLAFYGKLEPGKELCKDVSYVFDQCHTDVVKIVKEDCNDKQFCVFEIDKRFKDFCIAKYFYLDIRYSCAFRPTTLRPTTTLATTTQRKKTNRVKTTTKQTSAAKPITIYKETTRKKTTDTTTGIKKTSGSSTPSKTKSKSSSTGTSSKASSSSSSAATSSTSSVNVPINAPTSLPSNTRSSAPPHRVNTSVLNSGGRMGGKKPSMYWLLTAYSLVTDKSFIKANFTHLVLAIMLSIFIALVLTICFVLDHCRRRKRYQALKETTVEEQTSAADAGLENGPDAIDLEMRRGLIRPKGKPRGSILVTNGRSSNQNSRSLEEINHNSVRNGERVPLISLTASLSSVKHGELEESSFMIRSSTSECLPPPPDELLVDTPQQRKSLRHDEDSDSSTISIPPPLGFEDSECEDDDVDHFHPNVVITSPTPTSSSMSSTHTHLRGDALKVSGPNIQTSKRLNNEMYHGMSKALTDANLLQNNVSVQTNDLTQGSDRKDKLDNPGHVSMTSPQLEIPDLYLGADETSEIGNLEKECRSKEKHFYRSQNSRNAKESQKMGQIATDSDDHEKISKYSNIMVGRESKIKAKKGKLMVMKSQNTEPRRNETAMKNSILESVNSKMDDFENQSSIKNSIKRGEEKDSFTSTRSSTIGCSSTTTNESDQLCLSRVDGLNKQIFTVPNHRCGLGHSHPCVCTPQRTGSSSFICSCLDNAKYKNSVCCVENCPEQTSVSGKPYSSQRPLRGRHSDTLKRKSNRDKKRTSSLTDVSVEPPAEKQTFTNYKEVAAPSVGNGRPSAIKSATLSRIPTKADKILPINDLSMSLDRGKARQQLAPNGHVNNKMISVTVHSSKASKDSQTPRFEQTNDEELEKKNRSKIPQLSRSEESSDSSEKSDISIEALRSKSLPTSPTGKSRLKNGKFRLSPISEHSQRNKSTANTSWPRRSPKFKIQVVQSLHTDKRKPVNEV